MKAIKAAPKAMTAMKAVPKQNSMKAAPKKKAMKAATEKKPATKKMKAPKEVLAEIRGTFDDRAYLSGQVRVSLPGEGKWWVRKVILELVLQEWEDTNKWNARWNIGPSSGFFRHHPQGRE